MLTGEEWGDHTHLTIWSALTGLGVIVYDVHEKEDLAALEASDNCQAPPPIVRERGQPALGAFSRALLCARRGLDRMAILECSSRQEVESMKEPWSLTFDMPAGEGPPIFMVKKRQDKRKTVTPREKLLEEQSLVSMLRDAQMRAQLLKL